MPISKSFDFFWWENLLPNGIPLRECGVSDEQISDWFF